MSSQSTQANQTAVCLSSIVPKPTKWLGNEDRCRAILDKEDWSASADRFQLAAAVLSDEFSNAAAAMRRIGPDGPVKKGDYRDWPLFREARKNHEFAKAFEEVFGEPLRVPRVSKEPEAQVEERGDRQLPPPASEKVDA
jgi:hypothetical protein